MNKNKMDVILHPVRMRIVQNLVEGQKLTAQEISELLTDIPQATLYRHINKLRKAEIIEVVEKNQVRGTVEKVYSLSEDSQQRANEEFMNSSKDEQIEVFFTYLLNILGKFKKYLNQDTYDFINDGLSFSQVCIYADDEEFQKLATKINSEILKYINNKPSEKRRGRTLSTIIIPEANE